MPTFPPDSNLRFLLAFSVQSITTGSGPFLIKIEESDLSLGFDITPFCSSPENPFTSLVRCYMTLPPSLLFMIPAWIADPQILESNEYF